MIQLTKGTAPQILVDNAQAWTAHLLSKLAAVEEPTDTELNRYRHRDIKEALLLETAEKCAYCESKFRHVTFGDIEHIVPKSVANDRRYAWDNLTIACDICNQRKGVVEDIIDPYLVDPAEHLNFEGSFVFPDPYSVVGRRTEVVLDLNRPALLVQRSQRLQSLNRLLSLIVLTTDPNTRAALRADLESQETLPDKEFAAMSRTVIARQLERIDRVAGATTEAS